MPGFIGAAAAALVGLGMGAGGAYLSGTGAKKEAKRQQKLLRHAAAQVPLDYEKELNRAIGDIERLVPRASGVAHDVAYVDQDILDEVRERTFKGTKKRKEKILETIDAYLRGELSTEAQRAIGRSSAARGAARFGSLGGAVPLRAEAAELGRATEQQQFRGMELLNYLQGLYPTVQPTSVTSFLGGTPLQRLGMRQHEQSQIANILAQQPAVPSLSSYWGQYLSGFGGILTGAGMSGMTGGMGGGGLNMAGLSNPGMYKGVNPGVAGNQALGSNLNTMGFTASMATRGF